MGGVGRYNSFLACQRGQNSVALPLAHLQKRPWCPVSLPVSCAGRMLQRVQRGLKHFVVCRYPGHGMKVVLLAWCPLLLDALRAVGSPQV